MTTWKTCLRSQNTRNILLKRDSIKMSSPNLHTVKLDTTAVSHISEQEIARGEKLNIAKYTYKDHDGFEKTWEVVGRCYNSQQNGNSDCVGTVAVLRRMLKYDCLILVKQYRPPLKSFTLELPAGLINPVEKPQETAVRELKEETGYTCTAVKHISPLTALDPGLSKCTMKVVSVEVNGDDPVNIMPKQNSVDGEFIEVVHIPIDELLTRLNEYSEQGVVVDSRVYCFAIGLATGIKHATFNHQIANQD